MRSEHRAPFVASIVVVLACIGVLAHAVRTDALGGFARHTPMGLIAGTVLHPKPVVTADAPRPSDAAPVLPATEASKAPAPRPTTPARDPQRPAKPGGGQGTPHLQDDSRSHTTTHPVADSHAAPQVPATKAPDVVSSTSKPAPVPTSTPAPAAPPASAAPVPTSAPTPPGRGPGYGQGPRGLGQSITSAIATALTQALTDARDHSDHGSRDHGDGHDDQDDYGQDDDGHDHDGGGSDDRSDDHHDGRGGLRSWR